MASWWARWCLNSPASRKFAQPFVQAQIKENIKAPRHWPLWGEFTGHRWIRLSKGQWTRKMFPFDDVIMVSIQLRPSSQGPGQNDLNHDDVIKWKHFPRYWPFVRGIHRSTVNSPHKGQWRGTLMFSLICARINVWVNNGEAGDLRRNHAHYDVTVMKNLPIYKTWLNKNYIARFHPWAYKTKQISGFRELIYGICRIISNKKWSQTTLFINLNIRTWFHW